MDIRKYADSKTGEDGAPVNNLPDMKRPVRLVHGDGAGPVQDLGATATEQTLPLLGMVVLLQACHQPHAGLALHLHSSAQVTCVEDCRQAQLMLSSPAAHLLSC